MRLKTALFFSRCGKYGSSIGIALTCVSMILMHNLGLSLTPALLGMAFYLVNFYVYTSLTEHIEGRIKEETKK